MENTTNRSKELCTRVVTTQSFIEEAKIIYGARYDYSKTQYINREHRVTIICPIHGDFEIYAREHLDGKGCPKCEKSEKFLTKLRSKFGDKFGLEEYIYHDSTTPVTLICPKHGAFSRLPQAILNSSYGCPKCGIAVNLEACEKSHQESMEKKEEARKAKEAEQRAYYQTQIEEFKKAELKYKMLLHTWIENPNMKLPTSEDLFGGYDIYCRIVEQYKRVINYNAQWINEYKNQHHVPYLEAKNLSKFQVGDEVYKFEGEAPNQQVIDDYNRNMYNDRPLNEYLSGAGCEVVFENGDLYIYTRSLLIGISPNEIAGTPEVETYREMEEPRENQQRKVATQGAVAKYREQYLYFTNDVLTKYVEDLYPNIYEKPQTVAEEVVKELYRNQAELTETTFKRQLVYWSDHHNLIGYTIACKKYEETVRQYNALIEHIYEEAQQRTLYLSECPEYAAEGVKKYIDELYEDRGKTLAQKLFTLLNNRALRDSDQISGYVLPFHCYTEPNGDVIFTKERRTFNGTTERLEMEEIDDTEELENAETKQVTQSVKSGCLGVVVFIMVIIATFLEILL
ncbi:MAG: DUF723 domain-containing protein [Paludibacteraceae bacterium]|nr:DUF723 domain-containing protein [Paludibacteraceae bacterium]